MLFLCPTKGTNYKCIHESNYITEGEKKNKTIQLVDLMKKKTENTSKLVPICRHILT